MSRLRLLFIAESLNIGGAEKALVAILRKFDYSKFDITLMLISETGEFISEIKTVCDLKCRYYIRPSKNIFKSLINSLKIKALYKWLPEKFVGNYLCKNYDVVVAFCEGYLTKWVAASTVKCKKIAWVHTDIVNNDWPVKTGVFRNIDKEKQAYQNFNYVVGVSEMVSSGIVSKFGLKDVRTIYNLLDDSIASKALKTVDHHPISRLSLVSVGRLESVKGYDNLIEAVNQLVNNWNMDISLCIVGDGSQRYALESKVKSLDIDSCITFIGSQSNPYPYIKAADVYICSSLQEGFNIAILEAMTLAKPVIATDCAGPREILEDGKYGLLTDNSIDGLVDGISQFYYRTDLRSHFTKMSIIRANDFNPHIQVAKITELLLS